MKKLLFIVACSKRIGGVETVTNTLAEYLMRNGIEVHLISNDIAEASVGKNGIKYAPLPVRDPLDHPDNRRATADYIKANGITTVINQAGFMTINPEEKVHGVRYITTLHNSIYSQTFGYRNVIFNSDYSLKNIVKRILYYPYLRQRYKRVIDGIYHRTLTANDLYITLSPSYTQILKDTHPDCARKILTIPNPVTTQPSVGNKDNTIIYVGRLELQQKRLDRLIKIWGKICRRYPGWKLRIVGDGPDRQYFERLIETHRLINFDIIGFTDPKPYYSKAKIICLTSDYEGQPMSLIEAFGYGVVPVVYNCAEGVADMIGPDMGYLIPKGDEARFIAALETLMNNDTQWRSMSAKCIDDYAKYHIDNIINQWLDIII